MIVLARAALAEPIDLDLHAGGDPPEAIVHGETATAGDWPMTGAVLVHGRARYDELGAIEVRRLVCSGSLVAADVVLLAAHCVDLLAIAATALEDDLELASYDLLAIGFSREADLARFTDLDPEDELEDWPADVVLASSWTVHPGFDVRALEYGLGSNDDVALLFLAEPLDVPPATLPTEEEAARLEVGVEVEIVGWGDDEDDDSGTKRRATSSVAALGEAEMQIGAAGDDARKCHGDSGGPTFLDVGGEWRLVGVSSHAWDETGCDEEGGVDTRVDAHLAWIDVNLLAGEDDGAWAPPAAIVPLRGCGCAGAPSGAWLGIAGAVALARRRAWTRASATR